MSVCLPSLISHITSQLTFYITYRHSTIPSSPRHIGMSSCICDRLLAELSIFGITDYSGVFLILICLMVTSGSVMIGLGVAMSMSLFTVCACMCCSVVVTLRLLFCDHHVAEAVQTVTDRLCSRYSSSVAPQQSPTTLRHRLGQSSPSPPDPSSMEGGHANNAVDDYGGLFDSLLAGIHASPYGTPGLGAALLSAAYDAPVDDSHTLACTVCMTNKLCVAVSPCGHACLCNTCAITISKTTKNCPLCRGPIYVFTKIHLP